MICARGSVTVSRTIIAAALFAVLSAIILTAIAASGSLVPGDRSLADLLQATLGGRHPKILSEWIARWYIERGVVLVVSLIALRKRDYPFAVGALLVLAAAALNPVLKDLIQRDRPGAGDLIIREHARGYGYPSAHAMSAALFYGYALFGAIRVTTGRVRFALSAACLLAIALIGWERVYDGAHWPSDVAGGWAIGALLLFSAVWLPTRVLKLRAPSKFE